MSISTRGVQRTVPNDCIIVIWQFVTTLQFFTIRFLRTKNQRYLKRSKLFSNEQSRPMLRIPFSFY